MAERQQGREGWREVLDKLRKIREEIEATHGIIARDFVAEARAEREADMGRIWSGGP
jgi:hypothetical protein